MKSKSKIKSQISKIYKEMIYIGADHGGYNLKERIKEWLSEWGYDWEDCGNKKMDPNDDYPVFAFKVGEKVSDGQAGVLHQTDMDVRGLSHVWDDVRPSKPENYRISHSSLSESRHSNVKKTGKANEQATFNSSQSGQTPQYSENERMDWKDQDKGILACRSAAGMVIAANKVRGIRAAAVFDIESAKHSRTNNDANVVALSGDWLSDEEAKKVLKVWLETEFSGEARHVRRIKEIENYERGS